jgi:regulator of cell morphogenesis and NO signaling
MKDVLPARLLDAAVGELAATNLGACELFDRVGLNFAEDGERSVAEACRIHQLDESLVAAELANHEPRVPAPAGVGGALDETCRRVVRNHHGPLRASLGSLRTCLSGLCGKADPVVPVLEDARQRLEGLAESLLVHFAKEENILFPAFAALADAWQRDAPLPPLPFPTVMHPIRAMEVEHERLERELQALIKMASRHNLGGDAADLQDFRPQLESFGRGLAAHAHFENDLLFARALELERNLL